MLRQFTALTADNLLIASTPGGGTALKLMRIDVNLITAADHFLMVFSGTSVPANGTAPLIAPLRVPNAWSAALDLSEQGGLEVASPGIVLVLSSSEATLTKSGSGDITAYVEEYELQVTGMTTVGDTTTAQGTLEIWADSAGPKNLVKIEAKNSSGAVKYLQLHTADAPADGAVPLQAWAVAAGAYLYLHFSHGGLSPKRATMSAETDGCTLSWSSTQNTKTVAAATGPIRAQYL